MEFYCPPEFEEFIQDTSLEEEKNLLFKLVNKGAVEVPEQMTTKWSQSRNKQGMQVPYDVFILSNSNYKEQGFTHLKEMIDQRRGQVLNFRQEPFLQTLHTTKGFSELHQSNLFIEDVKSHQDEEEKLSSIILDPHQIKTLKEDLLIYFKEDEPFLNPQLSLKFVADVLEINTNKISYLINKAFLLNFNDFVNSYRLIHFKSIALELKNSHLTILGLAYESGFNTKSVFNTYFKRIEGITPSKWVKSKTN